MRCSKNANNVEDDVLPSFHSPLGCILRFVLLFFPTLGGRQAHKKLRDDKKMRSSVALNLISF